MGQALDERALSSLMEESEDLHADAMRDSASLLDEYVDAAQEVRSTRRKAGLTLAGVGVAGIAGLAMAGSASADTTNDIAVLQTAASIENLAVVTYKTALTLPYIGGSAANGVVKAFATKTMAQHMDHAAGFNAAAVKLGGKAQNSPDPKYLPVVTKAVPTIKGPLDVVGLAITLEDVAAQTYTNDVTLVSTADLRGLFASVAGVEAQHKAILLAVQALLKGGAAADITLPPPLAKLPSAAGSVGFPDEFYPLTMASPASEGAVS
jgi:hypothetical protein